MGMDDVSDNGYVLIYIQTNLGPQTKPLHSASAIFFPAPHPIRVPLLVTKPCTP